jgi:5-formyltetrahydrofolate cyclo-ligase
MSQTRPGPSDPRRASIMAGRRAKRADLLALRMVLAQADHRRLSVAVLDRLMAAFPAIRAERVGIYWPHRAEISIFPLAKRNLAEGGEISLPVIVERHGPLQFRCWKPGEPLSTGVYDIPFPRDGAVVQPDALIVPLVGFDEACHRLGYGGGYYDRTLAKANAKPLTIGIGFEFMRLASIEPLAHDIPMDFIVTEAGVFPRSRLTA